MQDATLVLRDIHQSTAPAWWPPAPGWWVLAAIALLAIGLWMWLVVRRRRQRRRVAGLFDQALAAAGSPAEEIAAMSELLRRAARRCDPAADRLHGEDWLAFLDEAPGTAAHRDSARKTRNAGRDTAAKDFVQGPGRLLLEGGYRREVDPAQVAELKPLARARFLQWMAGK